MLRKTLTPTLEYRYDTVFITPDPFDESITKHYFAIQFANFSTMTVQRSTYVLYMHTKISHTHTHTFIEQNNGHWFYE